MKLKKRVWGYTDCEFLVNLFELIAREWKGWNGAQEWASIEGEFGISATCDGLGHVILTITIKGFDGPEVWSAQVNFGLDSGKIENIEKKWGSSLQTKTSNKPKHSDLIKLLPVLFQKNANFTKPVLEVL